MKKDLFSYVIAAIAAERAQAEAVAS